MSDVSWLKLKVEMFSDDKIKLIESMPEADSILIIWIKLLCQSAKTNCNGYIFLNQDVPFTTQMLSTLFNRPFTIVELALKTLRDFGMISIKESGMILIENWTKHQNSEGLDKIREQTNARVRKHREKQKLLPSFKEKKDIDKEECVSCNVTETLQDQIDNIWQRSFSRSPKIPEIEETEKILKQFGYEVTLKLFKDAVNSGVKVMRTLIERTDTDGKFISYSNQNKFNSAIPSQQPTQPNFL